MPKNKPKVAEGMNDGDDDALSTACQIIEEHTLKPTMEKELAKFGKALKKINLNKKKNLGIVGGPMC